MSYSIKEVLMRRDGLDEADADELISEARELVANGADVDEVLRYEFGLEPDYMWDLNEVKFPSSLPPRNRAFFISEFF